LARSRTLRLLTSLPTAVAAGLVAPTAASARLLAPESGASPNADDSYVLYGIMLVIALGVVVAVNVTLLAAVGRFRASRGHESSRVRGTGRIQGLVASLAAAGAVVVLALGFGFLFEVRKADPSGPDGLEAAATRTAQKDLKLPPKGKKALRIEATGQQWLWRYTYPDGTFSYHDLVVPVDTTVVLDIGSTDVVHTWWVPALAGKFDAVPGSVNHAWFKAERTGEFEGRSATLSGPAYASMRTRVKVVSANAYKAWLEREASAIEAAQRRVADEIGRAAGGTS
jgi:cytochrome c oxidase subunit II